MSILLVHSQYLLALCTWTFRMVYLPYFLADLDATKIKIIRYETLRAISDECTAIEALEADLLAQYKVLDDFFAPTLNFWRVYLPYFLADLDATNNRIVLSNTFNIACIFGDVDGSVVEQWSRMLLQLMCWIVCFLKIMFSVLCVVSSYYYVVQKDTNTVRR